MTEGLFTTTETVRAHRRDLARLGTPRLAGTRLTAGTTSGRRARLRKRS